MVLDADKDCIKDQLEESQSEAGTIYLEFLVTRSARTVDLDVANADPPEPAAGRRPTEEPRKRRV